MSYILEALKKSESERNQGRVPHLGQQVRMFHRKRQRGIPAVGWLAIALVVNAAVLAVLFWPGAGLWWDTRPAVGEPVSSPDPVATADAGQTLPAGAEPTASGEVTREQPAAAATESKLPESADITAATGDLNNSDVVVLDTLDEAPTVIVPTIRPDAADADNRYTPEPWEGRVPHLVELPMAFQRQVPDLVFNSHVYSSRPGARRVMINNRYLKVGDSFGPLRVERITEEGVELSMAGQRFRVGVVRDWSSPR